METKRPTNPAAEELIGKYFPILDHGFACLIDYQSTDNCIENAARISYSGAGNRKTSDTRGLIRYLMSQRHTVPFESVQLKFHISCPIFVMRQWQKHRMSSTSEISGRYSLLPLIYYTPSPEAFQKQSKTNKQGRDEIIEIEKYKAAVSQWNKQRKESSKFYCDLADEELARELCRIDLSQSIYTSFYWSIDLHNLFHFLGLRCEGHAQYEIRQFANVLAGMTKAVAPISFEAWQNFEFGSTKFSNQEMKVLNHRLRYPACYLPTVMEQAGLSKREMKEFEDKCIPKQIPDFTLDLSSAKSYEHFEQIIKDHTPMINSSTQI